jgi:hypothetical protein
MSASESTPRPDVLDYARDPRRSRMRRVVRRGVAFLAVLAVIGGIYASRGFIAFRYHQWYWYHKCLTHVTPPGTVLFESDWTKAQALFTTNPEYFHVATYSPNVPPGIKAYTPGPGGVAKFAVYVPIELREFEKYVYVANLAYGYTEPVFLGERKRPDGRSRLVIIRSSTIPAERFPDGIRAYVCAPPTLLHGVPPPTITAKQYPSPSRDLGQVNFINLSPGVADPVDQTHLTIPASRGQTVDVYLKNDDTLTYSLRKLP